MVSSMFIPHSVGAEWPLGAAAPSVWSRICTIYIAPDGKSSVDVCFVCHNFKLSIMETSLDCYLDIGFLSFCGFLLLFWWLVFNALYYGAHHVYQALIRATRSQPI